MPKNINQTKVTKPYPVPERHKKTLTTLTPSRPVSMTNVTPGLAEIEKYPVRKGALDERYTPRYPGDVYGRNIPKQAQKSRSVVAK